MCEIWLNLLCTSMSSMNSWEWRQLKMWARDVNTMDVHHFYHSMYTLSSWYDLYLVFKPSIDLINQLIIDGFLRSFTQFQYQFISIQSSFRLALLCLFLAINSRCMRPHFAALISFLALRWNSHGVKCAINHSFSKSFLWLTSVWMKTKSTIPPVVVMAAAVK